jgi:hypothetical protein
MGIEETIAKVQKLRRLASKNTNANEAAAAAAAADRLIQEHGLHEAQMIEAAGGQASESAQVSPDALAEWTGKIPQWSLRLGAGLVKHYGCACYLNGVPRYDALGYVIGRRSRLVMVGRKSDVEACRYMYAWLVVEIAALHRSQRLRPVGRVWVNSFRHGCVQGVLDAMRRSKEAQLIVARGVGRASQGAALVLVQREAESEAALAKAAPDLRAGKNIAGASDPFGFNAGRRAGEGLHRDGGALGDGTGKRRLGR